MFTVKATYRQETRKIKFNDSLFFPSYDQLNRQLYRVFPISNNYVLSKLLFSLDSTKPSVRILIANEVRNADEYQQAFANVHGRMVSGSLLKFTVLDETPPKIPTPYRSNVSQMPKHVNDHRSSWASSFTSATTPIPGGNWDMNRFSSPASVIPPPPIIFSTPPVASGLPLPFPTARAHAQSPMEIDNQSHSIFTGSQPPSPAQILEDFWTKGPTPSAQPFGSTQHQPQLPQTAGNLSRSSSCCSVSDGKAEIQTLLTTFKSDLERIMTDNFGASSAKSSVLLPSNSPIIAPAVPGAWPETSFTRGNIPVPAPAVASTTLSCINMWCMVCGKLFGGPWYSCDKCSWHVLCPGCEPGHAAEHSRNFGAGHDMNKHTCGGCAFQPDQLQAAPTPIPNPVPTPTPAPDREATPTPAPVVHRGITCDVCQDTIIGVRHKCLDCPNYDLCTTCIISGSAEQHNPFHEFFEIEEPGRVVVHTVFSGDGEMDSSWTARRTTDNAGPRVVPSCTSASAAPVAHYATCDLCDSQIRGTRYKCVNCIDFDTCSSCFEITPEQHPHHGFVKIYNVDDLMMRDGLGANTRHYASCDGCKKSIYGIRYKCMHPDCPDFDLCAMCESHPIPLHPSKHPMLKMKTQDTIVPTVYRVGQTTLINSGPFAKSIKEEDEAIPTPPMPTEFEDEKLEAEFEASTEELESQPSSIASSTVGFKLPPLALDSRKDLFCEFWPKVTEELKGRETQAASQRQDVPQPNSAAPTANGASVRMFAELTDPFRDPEPKYTGLHSPELSTQALLSRPVSVPIAPEMFQQRSTPVTTHTRSLAALLNGYRSPSPQFTPSLAASMSSLDGTSQNDVTPAISSHDQEEHFLVGRFLSDTTVPDGQIFPPGAEFVKSWRILNDGPRDWPESTVLHYTVGESFALDHPSQNVKVGRVAAGLEVDVWTGELKAPETPGKYRGYWRLSDGEGTYFGNSLWVDIIVAEPNHQSDGSDGSLASSSVIMMPQSAGSARSTAPSDLAGPHGSLHTFSLVRDSSIGTVSKLSTDDAASDAGSVGSSVSLISVPSSDDEDAEDWQDSRSHAPTSPETLRDAAEYIVLFDDTSSDEEEI